MKQTGASLLKNGYTKLDFKCVKCGFTSFTIIRDK
jgi:hypothetical protein